VKKLSKHAKDKFFFGSVKVGARGQIVIPAAARKVFDINEGDQILVFGHSKKGLGLMKGSMLKNFATKLFKTFTVEDFEEEQEKNGE